MNPQNRRSAAWQMLLALSPSVAIVFFVFWGGWNLGFFLAVLVVELAFLGWIRLPAVPTAADLSVHTMPAWLQIALAIAVLDLSFCFVLYDNLAVRSLDFLVLLILVPLQYLAAAGVPAHDWDQPDFWLEYILSWIARPWLCLSAFRQTLVLVFRRRIRQADPADAGDGAQGDVQPGGEAPSSATPQDRPATPVLPSRPQAHGKTWLRILAGLVLALPVVLITGVLLTEADPVFADMFSRLSSWLEVIRLGELPGQLFVTLLLLPFIFSFLYSGKIRQRLLSRSGGQPPLHLPTEKIRFDPLILNTFLTCINGLYLVFAAIQLTYLTGAFQAALPDSLTYAEYARRGFFELAAVSSINLVLVLLAVKTAGRSGRAGRLLRAEALLLLAGSLVQWASAIFRMKMYVDAYGLTQLRFLVTAFMILQLALFLLLLVKELRPGLPLFKLAACVALAALIILNHVDGDAWIARYNAARYQITGHIDAAYFDVLSSSAVPAMLQLADADTPTARAIAGQLLNRYDQSLRDYTDGRWQNYNISRNRAQRLISDRLAELRLKGAAAPTEESATPGESDAAPPAR
jgi:hypothetical protein